MRIYRIAQGTLVMLCGDLNEKEIQKSGAICIQIGGSLCCTVEINTTLANNYISIKINLKKKKNYQM